MSIQRERNSILKKKKKIESAEGCIKKCWDEEDCEEWTWNKDENCYLKKFGNVLEPDINNKGSISGTLNSKRCGKCTNRGYVDFLRSHKSRYVDGLILSSCKDDSIKCELKCVHREDFLPGSSSGTINCEKGIYWFDQLPEKCKRYKKMDDGQVCASRFKNNIESLSVCKLAAQALGLQMQKKVSPGSSPRCFHVNDGKNEVVIFNSGDPNPQGGNAKYAGICLDPEPLRCKWDGTNGCAFGEEGGWNQLDIDQYKNECPETCKEFNATKEAEVATPAEVTTAAEVTTVAEVATEAEVTTGAQVTTKTEENHLTYKPRRPRMPSGGKIWT